MFKLYLKEVRDAKEPWSRFLFHILESMLQSKTLSYGVIPGDKFMYLSDVAQLHNLYLFDAEGKSYLLTLDLLYDVCKDIRVIKQRLIMPLNVPFSEYELSKEQLDFITQNSLEGWFKSYKPERCSFRIPYGLVAYNNAPEFDGVVIRFGQSDCCTTNQLYELLYDICLLCIRMRCLPQELLLPTSTVGELYKLQGKKIMGHQIMVDYNKLTIR